MAVRYYHAPVVTLLSVPTFRAPEHMPVRFLGEQTAAERLIEFAGRLCYMSQHNPADRTTRDYAKHLLASGHGSVLEHASVSVLAEGVSRSLTHEWVRHRAGWAYSQLSQRFVDESDAAFVIPPAILEDEELVWAFREQCEAALATYGRLTGRLSEAFRALAERTLRRKRAREAARAVLPNATETKIVMTGNLRAWRTVLGIRGDPAADMEINRLARTIAPLLADAVPHIFQDMTVTADAITFDHPKV